MIKSEAIQNFLARFESIACEYEGVECWSARELYPILGYAKWQTFENVLGKAKEACQNAGVETSNHFTGISKTILMPKGASKDIEDFMLTRYACYLVAQNGDLVSRRLLLPKLLCCTNTCGRGNRATTS